MSPDEPRIAPLTADEARATAEAAGIPGVMGDLNVFRILLHHPNLARALHDLIAVLIYEAQLDHRLRELAIMRVAWTTGSVYEWTQHWHVARSFGISDNDLIAVRDWSAHPGFGEAERAVLQATDETLETGTVSATTWNRCAQVLGGDAPKLLELVAAIGNWRLFSSLLRTLAIPLEDGTDPWPPDGRTPG